MTTFACEVMDGNNEIFLDEIVATPDDDGPRLIYADWLVEQGDPLGDFIHAQCTLARLAEWEPERAELKGRERELLLEHGRIWSGNLRRHGAADIRFRRGFVDDIKTTVPHLVRANLDILVDAPLLRSLEVRQAAGMIPALVGCEVLEHIDSLTLRDIKLDNDHLDRLTFSPFIGGLKALDLSVNEIGTAGVHHLAALRELRALSLEHNLLGATAAQVIASKDAFANLISLSLRGNRISIEGVEALARSPQLSLLQQLDVSENALGVDAITALIESHGLPALQQLDLRQNKIREEGAGRLALSPWLSRIERLNLRYNGVSDAGATALARSQHIEHLQKLELGGNQISDAGCRALAESPHFPSLALLDLSDNRITDAGVDVILASERLSRLCLLDLRSNPISEAGRETLKEALGQRVCF